MAESQSTTLPHVTTAQQLLAAHDGVVTSRELKASGVTSRQIADLVRRGTVERLRRDVLVDAEVWRAAPSWERHAPRARGVLRSLDPDRTGLLALSHHSALAFHGIALHGVDDLAHLVRVGPGRCYRSAGLQVHAPIDAEHVDVVDGYPAVRPAAAALLVAADHGPVSGLVAADSALRMGLCTRDDLSALLTWDRLRRGGSHVTTTVALADGRRESAGESRTAWALHLLGHDAAEPQAVIHNSWGEFVARVDFLLGRVVIEFDGMGKYADRSSLHGEKRREDALRALGDEVVRLTWEDLDDLAVVKAKIAAALARTARAA